jgi:hypothetical protein
MALGQAALSSHRLRGVLATRLRMSGGAIAKELSRLVMGFEFFVIADRYIPRIPALFSRDLLRVQSGHTKISSAVITT